MAIYDVTGADRETGQDRTVRVEAEGVHAAEEKAQAEGVLVSSVELWEEHEKAGGTYEFAATIVVTLVIVAIIAAIAMLVFFVKAGGAYPSDGFAAPEGVERIGAYARATAYLQAGISSAVAALFALTGATIVYLLRDIALYTRANSK